MGRCDNCDAAAHAWKPCRVARHPLGHGNWWWCWIPKHMQRRRRAVGLHEEPAAVHACRMHRAVIPGWDQGGPSNLLRCSGQAHSRSPAQEAKESMSPVEQRSPNAHQGRATFIRARLRTRPERDCLSASLSAGARRRPPRLPPYGRRLVHARTTLVRCAPHAMRMLRIRLHSPPHRLTDEFTRHAWR